ncbi:MAG: hypothetical protein P0Y53_08980 [Candidatus Pseudobacter hemicellulosilyticus]|uniref:HTH luxR-type domain-containing protein n=1 Tax=Candidatus Pseudobacter hemicellulosilyticus TaxID=3121375 RepID=A0AAJ5X040_9BACT|nr:MAG: hypothetical protein P0Y53_08980 [Pseudobacter sp.]
MPFLAAFSHQKDSLLLSLSESSRPEQQCTILHQLYELSYQDNYQEAEKYILAAVDISMRTSNQHNLLQSYKKLAALYDLEKKYMQSYIFYQDAQKIAIEEDETAEHPFLNYAIGAALYKLGRYPEAITFLQNANTLARQQKQLSLVPKATVFLGMSYYRSAREAKATSLFDSLETTGIKPDDIENNAFCHYQLQTFYQELQQYEKALQYNDQAAKLYMVLRQQHAVILCWRDRAALYTIMDSSSQAIACYRRALTEINGSKNYQAIKLSILDALSSFHQQRQDPVLAQSYERQAAALRDSLNARGKVAPLAIQSASYPQTLPFKKNTVQPFRYWQNRLIPLLLAGSLLASVIIYRRYKKIKSHLNEEKADALAEARAIAEEEKQSAILQAQQQIDQKRKLAADEARLIIEKAKEEARELQAQIAATSVLLANKTEYLNQLQEKLNATDESDFKKVAREIRHSIGENDYWAEFLKNFNLLHGQYIDKITQKHPDLTPNEVKLIAFTLSGLNNKEMAGVLSVEPESVKKARYRLKKKLRLTEEESLRSYLDSFK